MISPIQTKGHCRKVLRGGLSGNRLLAKLESGVNRFKKNTTLQRASALNNALMWHMAHCPDPEDRSRTLNLGTEIEPTLLKPLARQYNDDEREHLSSPIPFSPIVIDVFPGEDHWFIKCLPDVEFIWKEERKPQSPKSPLFAIGRVPGYKSQLIPAQDLDDPTKVYYHMRRALLLRNRNIFNPRHFQIGLLAQEPHSFYRHPVSESEQVFAFNISFEQEENLLFLFIKNNWPIGYGVAMPDPQDGVDAANVGYHVFKEFRGTPSSSTFFGSFLALTQERLNPSTLLFPIATRKFDPLQEYSRATAKFLKRHGFRWAPDYDNIMSKEVGRPSA